MNIREVKALSKEERQAKLTELELELMKERAQIASGTAPKNPGLLRENRRTIARIKTLEKINQ